ncbi:uncharacterized protein LOC122816356 [Protopterus annectens]|uniref:uncharacterized protein LOC122816356 n=1 Tax=Protopterus annectens TaxID=7888 RepID=UPI001CFB67F8|nr:uncharacterized protein LOC122816356 [Protopterus annectens]
MVMTVTRARPSAKDWRWTEEILASFPGCQQRADIAGLPDAASLQLQHSPRRWKTQNCADLELGQCRPFVPVGAPEMHFEGRIAQKAMQGMPAEVTELQASMNCMQSPTRLEGNEGAVTRICSWRRGVFALALDIWGESPEPARAAMPVHGNVNCTKAGRARAAGGCQRAEAACTPEMGNCRWPSSGVNGNGRKNNPGFQLTSNVNSWMKKFDLQTLGWLCVFLMLLLNTLPTVAQEK